MPRLTLRAFGYALALSLLFGCLPALAATSQPVLYSIGAGTPRVLAQGAQKSWPIKISEDNALQAVFRGGMWLPTPSGGRIYAKYQRHIVHANGIWTWVGTVETVHGAQQVVLTFGDGGVFGLIPQASGYPLRIVTNQGETRVVETSAGAMARSTQTLRLRSQRDYAIPPRIAPKGGQSTLTMRAAADAAVKQAAATSGPVTIDVMVAYSQGFANMLGSQKLALIRIQNLVDLTNQAYISSGVNQRIRLVYTKEVSYADNTSNQSALDDITGIDENGNPVSPPASLANIASLRTQYGADLAVLMRRYDNSTQGDCGVGWLIGGGQTAIVPSESTDYGYSVVSDGDSGGYYCLDTTFAHELGHNMGDAHDRANATSPGAYSYSYGYVGNGTNGFSTIMAYGTDTQTPLAVFSNPNISTCQNTPCGVADSASNSADNAHSMNNTAALIAQFKPTMVGTPSPFPGLYVHNDVNGDEKSDLLWFNPSASRLSWWIMNGTTRVSHPVLASPAGWKVVATGDFDGDGRADIVWVDSANNVYFWLNKGDGFTSRSVAHVAKGWVVAGSGDFDGDGRSDLLWYNPAWSQISWWLMDGPAIRSHPTQTVNSSWRVATTGDFYGDGKSDIAWTDASNNVYFSRLSGSSFAPAFVARVTRGWVIAGNGDVDGDGKADLFWHNASSARFSWWLMNGTTMRSHPVQAVNVGWHVAATGDFDGKGSTGVVWADSRNNVYLWRLSASSYSSQAIGGASTAWALVP